MHKNYTNGIISGNTIRFAGYNKKTDRGFVIVDGEKIKINKLNNSSKKSCKKYKEDYYIDYD